MSSEKIAKQNYSNMYTLMVTNSRSPAAKLVLRAPPKWRPATYLLLHCLLCYLAICAAVSHQPACDYLYSSVRKRDMSQPGILKFHLHLLCSCDSTHVLNIPGSLPEEVFWLQAVFWHSKALHTTVLVLCSAMSAWNGAVYHFDVFAHKYVESVGLKPAKPQT